MEPARAGRATRFLVIVRAARLGRDLWSFNEEIVCEQSLTATHSGHFGGRAMKPTPHYAIFAADLRRTPPPTAAVGDGGAACASNGCKISLDETKSRMAARPAAAWRRRRNGWRRSGRVMPALADLACARHQQRSMKFSERMKIWHEPGISGQARQALAKQRRRFAASILKQRAWARSQERVPAASICRYRWCSGTLGDAQQTARRAMAAGAAGLADGR